MFTMPAQRIRPRAADQYNLDEFDCRKHVKPGDVVEYKSYFVKTDSGSSNGYTVHRAVVSEVHERFIFVKLRFTREGVNRWDIIKVNRRHVTNGRFEK